MFRMSAPVTAESAAYGWQRMVLEINLPWPSKELFQNSAAHWRTKARQVKAARKVAFYLTLEQRPLPYFAGDISVTILIYEPDRRKRDTMNIDAAMKAAVDGIFDALKQDNKAGDDSQIRRVLTENMRKVVPGGRVTMIVEDWYPLE